MADTRDWVNQSQPQTLVIACFLLYVNAAFELLFLWIYGGPLRLILVTIALVLAQVFAGRGLAQERKWGYNLAVGAAFAPILLRFPWFGGPYIGGGILSLMFDVALIVLVLHPQSREYKKIWFK